MGVNAQPMKGWQLWAQVATLLLLGFSTVFIGNQARNRPEKANRPAVEPIDPARIGYHEVERIATDKARGIALDRTGNLLAGVGNRVRRYARGQWNEQYFGEEAIKCLALAADGACVIGLGNGVQFFNRPGHAETAWRLPEEKACITSVAVDGKDLFIADAGARVVYRYNRAGKLLRRIGEKDEARGIPGLVVPSPHLDIALAPDGLLWVANPGRHQLEAYHADGTLVKKWGQASTRLDDFTGCCNPVDIAVLPDGRLVTAEKGTPQVKVYHPDGTLDTVVAGPESFASGVQNLDLAVDMHGRIYVLDGKDGIVHIFARKEERSQ